MTTRALVALLCSVVGLAGVCDAGYCAPFQTRISPYPGCHECDSVDADFTPRCTGRDARLVRSAPVPVTAGTRCITKCFFNCSQQVGVNCCPGYNGPQCEVDIDACTTSPCPTGAECIDLPAPAGAGPDGRQCQCRVGWSPTSRAVSVTGCTQNESSVTYIRNADFADGTVIIDRPGSYRLAEDILFNPNSRSAGGDGSPRPNQFSTNGGKYDRRAYGLGFFAAVAIVADHVSLDLGGFSIEQSVEHALIQRFYASIELADVPFHYDQGPHNFTTDRINGANHVSITNGVLARASHHGIHGHNNSYVLLKNLTIRDFEVAAISLNGGASLSMEQISIGPSRHDVPVRGIFSTGRFIRPYVEAIVAACPDADITLAGVRVAGWEILQKLNDVLEATFQAVVCGSGEIPALVNNLAPPMSGLPDGSAIYGIVLHNYGSHTNGFVLDRHPNICLDANGEAVGMLDEHDPAWYRCVAFAPSGNTAIRMSDVSIEGLELRVNEVEALPVLKFDASVRNWVRVAQVDVVGAVYQYEVNVVNGNFMGNDISNAQLFVAKNLGCIRDPDETAAGATPAGCRRKQKKRALSRRQGGEGGCQRNALGGNPDALATSLNTITNTTLDWAANGGLYTGSEGGCLVIGGGDNMFHVNKGAIAIRIDAGVGIDLRNVEIDTVRNTGRPVGTLCNDLQKRHPAQSQSWYTGTDAVGFSCASCRHVALLGSNKIRNIQSLSGNAYAMQFIRHTDYITGNAVVGRVSTQKGAQFYDQLSAEAIYAGRPPVTQFGGPPVADVIFIDDYACIPGDGMDMNNPTNDTMMGGMVMNDDPYAPPDPHTMTCGVVAELEARSVPPKTYPLPRPRAAADSLCTSGGALARADAGGLSAPDAGGLSAGTFWGVAVGFAVVLVVALVIVVKKTKTLKGVRLERHGSMSLTFANPNAYDSAAEVDGVDGSAETSA